MSIKLLYLPKNFYTSPQHTPLVVRTKGKTVEISNMFNLFRTGKSKTDPNHNFKNNWISWLSQKVEKYFLRRSDRPRNQRNVVTYYTVYPLRDDDNLFLYITLIRMRIYTQ